MTLSTDGLDRTTEETATETRKRRDRHDADDIIAKSTVKREYLLCFLVTR